MNETELTIEITKHLVAINELESQLMLIRRAHDQRVRRALKAYRALPGSVQALPSLADPTIEELEKMLAHYTFGEIQRRWPLSRTVEAWIATKRGSLARGQ